MTEKAPATAKPIPTKSKAATRAPAQKTTPKTKPVPTQEKSKPVVKRVKLNAIKSAKTKMVRDNYTMPATDYALLVGLKKSCLQAGLKVKKGELLRAGLRLLAKQSAESLMSAVKEIQQA